MCVTNDRFFFFLTQAARQCLVIAKMGNIGDLLGLVGGALVLDIKIEMPISHANRDVEPAYTNLGAQ